MGTFFTFYTRATKKYNSRYLKSYVKVEPILSLYCDVVRYICTQTNSSVVSRVFTNFILINI